MNNIAFVDGQNLYLGTKEDGWIADYMKFRRYLHDTYGVKEAYYFLGYIAEENQGLYDNLQKSGFIVKFKEHRSSMKSKKKGNVDADIVFEIMKHVCEKQDDFEKIVLVSGDGDYFRLVQYLIKKERFLKLLSPNKKFLSSLYKSLTHT